MYCYETMTEVYYILDKVNLSGGFRSRTVLNRDDYN